MMKTDSNIKTDMRKAELSARIDSLLATMGGRFDLPKPIMVKTTRGAEPLTRLEHVAFETWYETKTPDGLLGAAEAELLTAGQMEDITAQMEKAVQPAII